MMCWALYAASDQRLPTIAWDTASPAFYAAELAEDDLPVRRQFSLPNVLYLGSHEGCGCGFLSDAQPADTARSCSALAEYLAGARQSGAALEVFLCWEGGQGNPAAARLQLAAEDFGNRPFPLGEDEFSAII